MKQNKPIQLPHVVTTTAFDLAKGLAIQATQLEEWKSVLQPAKFKLLLEWIRNENNTLSEKINFRTLTGYDVVRGTDIDSWIKTNLIERK
jgi:hypothetical protein